MTKHIIPFLGLILGGIVFAQTTTPTIPVPTSVSTNCLTNQSGGIDFCPTYRNQVRDTNTTLAKKRSQAEASGVVSLLDVVNLSLTKLSNQSNTLIKNTLSGYPLFAAEYEQYITTLMYQYIKDHSDDNRLVNSFWETTYFDQDQSGLGISDLKIYKGIPKQYDDSILLQVSVRNYTNNPLSNIEDLYCFSTVNNQDYIYPMGTKTSFKENTITNLIVELKPGISPLLEQVGEKKIACTLVYSQFGQTKYTNRGKLLFTLN